MQSWTLQPILHPIVLAVVVAILIGLVLLGPSFANLSRGRRLQLKLLRFGIVLLALTAMLRPGCVKEIEQKQSGVYLLLADVSRSMELPHRADESSRWDELKKVIKANESRIQELAKQQVEVRFFGFSNEVRSLIKDGSIDLQTGPTGAETDIGTALYRQTQEVRNERLMGVFVHSDFVQNASDPEIDISRATDALRDLQVPLYAVQYGLPGDNGQVSDVAITNLPEQHRIAVKNELTVSASVVARGYINKPITIKLYVTNKKGEESVADSIDFTPTQANEQKQIQLKYVPTSKGQFRMRVRAEPMDGEIAIRNNELPSFLTVRQGGVRILFLAPAMGTFEQKAIKNSLRRAAQDFDIVYKKIDQRPSAQSSWPLKGEVTELLRDETFDVIIIGDVDSRALYSRDSTENIDALIQGVVDEGKGLLMLGGYHSFEPGLYHQTPLVDILPIEMDPAERNGQSFSMDPKMLRDDLHINRSVKIRLSHEHFITTLSQFENPLDTWDMLPPLGGANRFVQAKIGADILLETESGRPILVANDVGGRILAFAGDTTHRWRTHWRADDSASFGLEFDTFWRQVILWLAFKDRVENNSISIDLPQRRFKPRAFVQFKILVGQDLRKKNYEIQATLVKPDQSTAPISVVRNNGVDRGQIDRKHLTQAGLYQIIAVGKTATLETGNEAAEFVVFDQDKEKSIVAADLEQGQRLASQTKDFGGRVVYPEEFSALLDEIISNPKELKMSIPLKWQLGATLPDASIFLVLFVGLLSTEWFLRKKWGLV